MPSATDLNSPDISNRNVASPTRLSGDFCAALNLPVKVALLTGGFDKPYAYGLATSLMSRGVHLEIVGSEEVDSPEFHGTPQANFLDLRGTEARSFLGKSLRVTRYYLRLLKWAITSKSPIFHILWNNKFQTLDRTLLMLFYKSLGKKIAFTAHNVNAAKRDSKDSLLNRATLKIQYRLADCIFVHTDKMKNELVEDFGISDGKVIVIPFGINNSVPNTDLSPETARKRLGIGAADKVVLFFGNIGPYKGLEFLVSAFQSLAPQDRDYRLIIAGKLRGGSEKYFEQIRRSIDQDEARSRIVQMIDYIPDEDAELYLKAADVLVLPYREVFQSGVLFLAYSFGLPVIATDVGSLKEDIIEGKTGFICQPCDSADLARKIDTYFRSDLFKNLDSRRQDVREYANSRNSWGTVSEITVSVYQRMAGEIH